MSESIPVRPCAYCGTPTPINEDCSCLASEIRRIGHEVEERSPNDSEAPMTEDHIPPALTPAEWQPITGAVRYDGDTVNIDVFGDHGDVIVRSRSERAGSPATIGTPREKAAALALLNAALPNDSPYKITREDVTACKEFDFNFWGADGDSIEIKRVDAERLQRLAAKLAALLRPE